MIILDGLKMAEHREAHLRQRIQNLSPDQPLPVMAAILFTQDPGSVLYTEKKAAAAERVGIQYQVFSFSLLEEISVVQAQIQSLNDQKTLTGIIIQKPTRKIWNDVYQQRYSAQELSSKQLTFESWWRALVTEIEPTKDVDGLHPSTLKALQENTWQGEHKVLPATCRAVIELLKEADSIQATVFNPATQFIILGKSDLLGQPLFYYLKNQGLKVSLIGSRELALRQETGVNLADADVIISSTGRPDLITGDLVKLGSIIIDVGEPQGDVDFESVKEKAAIITPVPGGVGPMTVICLLENCYDLLMNVL